MSFCLIVLKLLISFKTIIKINENKYNYFNLGVMNPSLGLTFQTEFLNWLILIS